MRVVFVGPFALQPKRTMAVRAMPLARALARRGHQLLVLLPPWDFPRDAGRQWEEGGVLVRNVPLPASVPGWSETALTCSLVRASLSFAPDVLHCFKPKSYSGLTAWALWQCRRLGLGHMRLFVDSDDWEGAGGWNDLERYSWLQKRFFARQENWGMTHNDGLTVASRALQTIAWSLGVPRRKLLYLPNGAPLPAVTPTADQVTALRLRYGLGDAPVVLLYTRFFEFGLDRALAIMQGTLERVPRVRWLVVGQGLFGEEETLLSMSEQRQVRDRVVYAGWVPEPDLPAHFALARAAIYPFDDTLVNRCKCAVKLLDLLVAGVPVVADRVGQNSEYIENEVSGLLVDPGDVAAFVAATARVVEDRALGTQLGRTAQQRIRTEYSWDRLAEQVEEVYRTSAGLPPPLAVVSPR